MNTPAAKSFLPNDATRAEILNKAALAFRSLLDANLGKACDDAISAFQEDEDAPAPAVSISFKLSYPLGETEPKLKLSASWSARRKDEAEVDIDGTQTRMDFQQHN